MDFRSAGVHMISQRRRRELAETIHPRYLEATKAGKEQILYGFITTAGYFRKYARPSHATIESCLINPRFDIHSVNCLVGCRWGSTGSSIHSLIDQNGCMLPHQLVHSPSLVGSVSIR